MNNIKKTMLGLMVGVALSSGSAYASMVIGDLPARPGEDGGGISYAAQMIMDSSSETVSGSVGSRAWGEHWTHTSIWAYIDILTAGTYQISVSPNASDLIPALSLYQGVDNSGADDHSFDPTITAPAWVDAAGFGLLQYLSGPNAGNSAVLTRYLNAGEYTLVLGGNDFATPGHLAGFTYSVTAVPVPAAALLFGSGIAGLLSAAGIRRKPANLV